MSNTWTKMVASEVTSSGRGLDGGGGAGAGGHGPPNKRKENI